MPPDPAQQMFRFLESSGLVCAPSRNEPAVWVRRIVLWHDVSREPIRNIELKRGLNIIWSPVGADSQAPATGHAAGKTLLCRLLRYCLGEDSFADPDDTAEIRRQFPDGAVGAEVRLRGQTWVVRRAFRATRDDRALQADTLESIAGENLRGSFAQFLEEIDGTIFEGDSKRVLAELEDIQDAWQYVLAWLTRDQECRIDGLTHWRHPESSSHSPVRKAGGDARLNVLRIVLGLFSTASSSTRKEIAVAARRAKVSETAASQAEVRFDSLRLELATALEVGPEQIWPPPTEFFQDERAAQDAHLQSLVALADRKIRAIGAVPYDPNSARIEEQFEKDGGELARVTQKIENLGKEIDRKREHVGLLGRDSAQYWADVREAKHPVCPYDGTPLDVEKAKFVCPLPHLPDPAAASRIAAETDIARKKAAEELTQGEQMLTGLKGEKASLDAKIKVLQQRIDAHQLAVSTATQASQDAWASKSMVRRLLPLRAEADEAHRVDAEAKDALRELQNQQIASLSTYSTAKLQRWFDFLIQRVVAPEANGTVVLDGNGLHPRIQWRGRRRSVALNSLQIVLFDLAAMLCAVEGDSRAPAFLVHDSPREGDLDPWTYSRIFEALFELGPDENSAPFQYIVTTTSDPPEGARSRVRLELTADADEHRLFRVAL